MIDSLLNAIFNLVIKILFWITMGIMTIVSILDRIFSAFAGLSMVEYQVSENQTVPVYLLDVFLHNHTVRNAYWGMALLGITVGFGFAIVAVIRKMFDGADAVKESLQQIMINLFKCILLILSTTIILDAVLEFSAILMRQVNYILVNAETLDQETNIVFTDEQYAAMARVLNTIGNYSINPTYDSRYNINLCYNDIRGDMEFLSEQGVFRNYYVVKDNNGKEVENWQAMLTSIANTVDLSKQMSLDEYNESLSEAIKAVMVTLRNNPGVKPLKEYHKIYKSFGNSVPLDRVIFLLGVMDAAKNPVNNQNASFTDPLRYQYYTGEKDCYDMDVVSGDFDLSPLKTNYIIIFFIGAVMVFNLLTIILACAARIFNLILLLLVAPLSFSTMPLDSGGKMRQWRVAFIVQAFGIFGTVIAMRVLLLFMPIAVSNKLIFFKDSGFINYACRLLLIVGAFEAAKRASGMVTGILSDNAGYQSVMAGDMASSVEGYGRMAMEGAKAVGSFGATTLGFLTGATTIKRNFQERSLPELLSGGGGGGGGGGGAGGEDPEKTGAQKETAIPERSQIANQHADGSDSGQSGGSQSGGGQSGGSQSGGGQSGRGQSGGSQSGGGQSGDGRSGGSSRENNSRETSSRSLSSSSRDSASFSSRMSLDRNPDGSSRYQEEEGHQRNREEGDLPGQGGGIRTRDENGSGQGERNTERNKDTGIPQNQRGAGGRQNQGRGPGGGDSGRNRTNRNGEGRGPQNNRNPDGRNNDGRGPESNRRTGENGGGSTGPGGKKTPPPMRKKSKTTDDV